MCLQVVERLRHGQGWTAVGTGNLITCAREFAALHKVASMQVSLLAAGYLLCACLNGVSRPSQLYQHNLFLACSLCVCARAPRQPGTGFHRRIKASCKGHIACSCSAATAAEQSAANVLSSMLVHIPASVIELPAACMTQAVPSWAQVMKAAVQQGGIARIAAAAPNAEQVGTSPRLSLCASF